MIQGRARETEGHFKPTDTWTVLIRDHHTGYIAWEKFERNQVMLTENAHMKSRMEPKAARGGRSLLAGLLRCRRCGRMLHVAHSGRHGELPRCHCRGAHINHGGNWCISFGGLRPDRAIAWEILKTVEGNAIEAALESQLVSPNRTVTSSCPLAGAGTSPDRSMLGGSPLRGRPPR